MAPTPETSSSVGILEHRVMVKYEGLPKYIRFMTVELHDCSGQCHFSIVIRISFSICMIFAFNVREICWVVSFCFWILLSWGHVVECVKRLQTRLWGTVFFLGGFCMFQITNSFQQRFNGRFKPDTCWPWGLRCCLINRACWMKNSRCRNAQKKHRVKLSDADQKWWILYR